MTTETDPRSAFETIVRASSYMTLATADPTGRPWASPVWFASTDCQEFFWVSSPQTRHSQNLAVRPELAISIFDSHQVPYTSQGVYVAAIGEAVPESELDAGLEVYSGVSRERGLPEWDRSKVLAPAKPRLYRGVGDRAIHPGAGRHQDAGAAHVDRKRPRGRSHGGADQPRNAGVRRDGSGPDRSRPSRPSWRCG